jgi:hypothetical protein
MFEDIRPDYAAGYRLKNSESRFFCDVTELPKFWMEFVH